MQMITSGAQRLPIAQLEIEHPRELEDETMRFYRDGLGFRVVGTLEGEGGFNKAMFNLPAKTSYLEVTDNQDESPNTRYKNDLLVLYMQGAEAVARAAERLKSMGYKAARTNNPYWESRGAAIEDPTGRALVIASVGSF